ncbi:uncharacterized protein Triagg1_8658 [Trichoderma aggressivum f. europaeum]|uniref:Uncharacterized protein n=1 Tax=Trichoderma aggressivum f. europaeum TaxID=173218 RepID=A0AAE1I829_9HYPO|nr:hypothetical protein Triagg1_8658 [Trichoderma aggressivum f. europaeum]
MASSDELEQNGVNDNYDIVIDLDHGEMDIIKAERGAGGGGQEDEKMAFGIQTGSSKLSTSEMERSFNLWVDYTALGANISRLLDTRQFFDRKEKEMVTELLQMLARNIQWLNVKLDALGGSSSNDSDTDECEDEARDGIQCALDRLHLIAADIRRIWIRSLKYNLASSFHQNDDSYFHEQACILVRYYFRDARRSLCDQLGASLAIRRSKLLQRMRHEENFGTRHSLEESKHHMDDDTEPYVCLSEDCTSPMLFFVHMKDWMNHMEMFHSEQWNRSIHMSIWYCDIDHKPAIQFDDYDSFVRHMKDPANHEGQEPPTDRQLDTLSREKQKLLFRDEYCCPICKRVPSVLEPVILNSSPDEIRRQLYEHIAADIKDLALRLIPTLDEAEPSEYTQSEVDDGDHRRLRGDNLVASYLSRLVELRQETSVAFVDNPDRDTVGLNPLRDNPELVECRGHKAAPDPGKLDAIQDHFAQTQRYDQPLLDAATLMLTRILS